MKKYSYSLQIILVFFISFSINAQSVEEIINNYIENTGGFDNWSKVKSKKMNMSVNQMGMEIPIEQYISSERTYSKITIQGREIMQGVYDGETLWSTNFMTMKAEKSNQEDTQMVKNELAEFPDPFLNYKKKGFIAELMGVEFIDGLETFKIKLTKKPLIINGDEVSNTAIYFFDSKNYIPVMMQKEIMAGPAKGMIMEARMNDYQEVDEGLYMPFSMSQGIKNQPGQPITIKSIELNVEVDDKDFIFPPTTTTEDDNN